MTRLGTGYRLLALALLLAAAPFLRDWHARAAAQLAGARHGRIAAEENLRRFRDDAAAARKLEGQIAASEIEKALAPADRIAAATVIERAAKAGHLSRLSYTLSPEKPVKVPGPDGDSPTLALTTISIAGDAPLDGDIYDFISALGRALPGRIGPRQISIERIAGDKGEDISAANLRFRLTLDWLSNGAAEAMAGGS